MKRDITELYLFVDDFSKAADQYFQSRHLSNRQACHPTRVPELSIGEVLTILLLFHQSPCKNFKYFYKGYLAIFYREEFPKLCSYQRFIELKPRALPYLTLLLHWFCEHSYKTGVSFVDATSLAVCHVRRISVHKVFKGLAAIGKTTKGWFLGLKLHLIINEKGQIQGVQLSAGNVDDRTPVPELTKRLKGLLFADKGYISQSLFNSLFEKGLKLVTGIKKNMKNKRMSLKEKMLLGKRSLIETVFDLLKNKFQIEHTRHRSPLNALVHILSTLTAYSLKPTKPHIKFNNLIPN